MSPSLLPTSLTPALGAALLTHLALLLVELPHHCVAVLTNCVVATAELPEPYCVSGCVIAVAPLDKLNPLALAVATVVPATATLIDAVSVHTQVLLV